MAKPYDPNEQDDPNDPYPGSQGGRNDGGSGGDDGDNSNNDPVVPPPPGAPAPGSGAPGSGNGPDSINHGPPAGVTQAQWDAYLAKNPGDYYRGYNGAFTDDNTNGGAGAGGSGGGGGNGGSGGGFGNSNLDQLYQLLLQQLTGQTQAKDAADAALRKQVMDQISAAITEGSAPLEDVSQSKEALAYKGALDRGAADTQSALAERRTAQGLGGSNMDTEVLGLNQDKAMAQSQYEAGIAHSLLMDKKDRLEKALSLGAGIMSDDQRAQVQTTLANTNTALSMFQSLLSNQYNYDQLGYWLAQQEANANANSVSTP